MTKDEVLQIWRDLPSQYKQFDELLLAFVEKLKESPVQRDWVEDAELENGNYFNQCAACNITFIGHKRRVVCKACDSASANKDQR